MSLENIGMWGSKVGQTLSPTQDYVNTYGGGYERLEAGEYEIVGHHFDNGSFTCPHYFTIKTEDGRTMMIKDDTNITVF